jgi:hypothetical protein
MTDFYTLVSRLIDLVMQPGPQICFALLPALVALAGWASLHERTDDRQRAWVQIVSALATSAWMVLPWHPDDVDLIGANRVITLFAFGYVMADWGREMLRSDARPRWAHGLVLGVMLLALGLLVLAAVQIPAADS